MNKSGRLEFGEIVERANARELRIQQIVCKGVSARE